MGCVQRISAATVFGSSSDRVGRFTETVLRHQRVEDGLTRHAMVPCRACRAKHLMHRPVLVAALASLLANMPRHTVGCRYFHRARPKGARADGTRCNRHVRSDLTTNDRWLSLSSSRRGRAMHGPLLAGILRLSRVFDRSCRRPSSQASKEAGMRSNSGVGKSLRPIRDERNFLSLFLQASRWRCHFS